MRITVEVDGLAELDRALAELGPESTKVGRRALRAVANETRDVVKAAAPVGTGPTGRRRRLKSGAVTVADYGRLRDNIRVREERARKDSTVIMQVSTGDAFWGQFLEFGTRFMSARPWMRPAWDAHQRQALASLQAQLGKGIERTAKRLARLRRAGRI